MGSGLSLLAPQAHTVALRAYVDVLPGFIFLDVMNDSRFLKTIKAYDTVNQTLVVVKVFIKPPAVGVKLQDAAELLGKEAQMLATHPNVQSCHRFIETDSAGYMVRQLVKSNLYDRLSLRPFLTPIEKHWIAFQLLKTLQLLHDDLHICHGDIKTENLLISSSSWLTLTDFSQHIKPVYLQGDNPSEFVFYFDSSNRRTCYVAPERFYSKEEAPRKDAKLLSSMDLFSAGCAIAELYNDGEPTFTLSDLYKYKKGELETNISGIQDVHVRELVKNLINIEPKKRSSARDLLEEYRGSLFPSFFYEYLYGEMCDLNNSELFEVPSNNEFISPSDLRIERIYNSFDRIIEAFDFSYSADDSRLRDTGPLLRLNLKGLPRNYTIRRRNGKTKDGALIVLNTVCSLMGTLKRPENKIKACELILAISEHISDEAKLDRSIPYICSLIDEFLEESAYSSSTFAINDGNNFPPYTHLSTRIPCVALVAATNLLETCSSVNAINAHLFTEYISPLLKNIAFLNSPHKEEVRYLRITLAACLPYLAKVSESFASNARNYHNATSPYLAENGGISTRSRIDSETPKSRSLIDIKDLTEALLTDPDNSVRIGLVHEILPLCEYFGPDKTNDLILPHLITYLNDPSYQLRLAFLGSITQIGPFIGALSFEQYLLPLLFQTLGDHEHFVVLKILEIFHHFLKERLINPSSEFNALSVYKEILSNCIPLLLQPNEWIRQSVLNIILVVSDNLSNADRFCFLYPIIKSYLSYDISVISWQTLYPCVTNALSRQVYETALTWSTNASSKSLFWKQTKFSAFHQVNGRKKLVSYTKDIGKSVYVPHSTASSIGENARSPEISLSSEDKQWILKLKSVGMDDRDLWKVFTLKDHFISYHRSKLHASGNSSGEYDMASRVNVPPINVFFDICFKTEAIDSNAKRIETTTTSRMKDTGSFQSTNEGKGLHFAASKAKASASTIAANVLGELETSHADGVLPKSRHHHHVHSTTQNSNSIHRVYGAGSSSVISATMRHNYEEPNPHVLNYLHNISFGPTIDDFHDFGSLIRIGSDSSYNLSELKIRGTLVTQVNAKSDPSSQEIISKIAICPTSEFFVTGSEDGKLKVWDITKLDKNFMSKSPSISTDLKSAVTDIVFLPHRFVFAVGTNDGNIHLYRLLVTRNKNKKITKYAKLYKNRMFTMKDGFAVKIQFASTQVKSLCIAITSTCKIIAFDIITSEIYFDLQNPLIHGVPSAIIVAKNATWTLVGTSDGVLCLWDLRFDALVRSWRVTLDAIVQKNAIKKLMVIPASSRLTEKTSSHTYFAMIGGSNEADTTIWEIPSFECREVYTADTESPQIKKYALQEIKSQKDIDLNELFADFALHLEKPIDASPITLDYVHRSGAHPHNDGYFIQTTGDSRVLVWDLEDIKASVSVFDKDHTFSKTKVNSRLSVAHEQSTGQGRKKQALNIPRYDAITGLVVIQRAPPMIVAVERNGTISIYR
ncbi:hypothetical protein FDK38_004194 [Candidozyma auris]|nr:hypothetical protein FDK38_004194 [[Candida] auris]